VEHQSDGDDDDHNANRNKHDAEQHLFE